MLNLTQLEQGIIDEAMDKKNPSILSNYFFRNKEGGYLVYPGSVLHDAYTRYLAKTNPNQNTFVAEWGGVRFEVEVVPNPENEKESCFFEKRGYLFLPWIIDMFKAPQEEVTIVGTAGTGKTSGVGMLAMYYCATIPNFRFLNVAPRVYQSNLMSRSIMENLIGSKFRDAFILPGRKGIKESPYMKITFINGSTAEFMNIEKNAANIQSWSGDYINVDEAGLLNTIDKDGNPALATIRIGIASRLRGTRPDGKPRMGRVSMISMAYDCPPFWERYDLGKDKDLQKTFYSRLVTAKDNVYLSAKDRARILRNVPPGHEKEWLEGERPPVAGAEFSRQMVESLFSINQMDRARNDPQVIIEEGAMGVIRYEEPYIPGRSYLIAGDPGCGDPPSRNSPAIIVFDVTDFPTRGKAKMVAFNWIFGNGSYLPFVANFERLFTVYRVPSMFRGLDSTATQKGIAELAWTSEDIDVNPLGFDGQKKWMYINSLKMLAGKNLIQIPAGIKGIENQVRSYVIPDKKIAQDIVSCLAMSAFLMYPLYLSEYPEYEEDNGRFPGMARTTIEKIGRETRPVEQRYSRRSQRQ